MTDLQQRLESEAGQYFLAVEQMLRKLLDWHELHEKHDHKDPTVASTCLRNWKYLEHEGKVLVNSGPA